MSAEPFGNKHRDYLDKTPRDKIIADSQPIARGWRYNPHGMCWILPGALVPTFLEPENRQGRVICLSEQTWFATAAHRAVLSAVAEQIKTVVCWDCGRLLVLCHGRRSGKWFWRHVGLGGCEYARPFFFNSKEEAMRSEEVFQ